MNRIIPSYRIAGLALAGLLLAGGVGLAVARQPGPAAHSQSVGPAGTDPRVTYATFHSASLDKDVNYAVLLPASYNKDAKRRYPVLYFLHGMNGNEREFERRGVAATVEKMETAGKIGEV